MSCVPLMRARPSLASSVTGASPAARSASPPGGARPSQTALAFADERQGQVRERRQVAAGPHRALRGDDGMDAAVEQGDQQVEGLGPDAAEALGQDVRAQRA